MTKGLTIISLLLTSIAFGQVEIFNEDFESGIPATFSIVDNDGLTVDNSVTSFSDAWVSLQDPDDNTNSIVGSTSFFDPTGQANRWLITPSIDLGLYGNILKWDAKSHDPSNPDGFMVLISTTDAQISSFTDTAYVVFQEFANWSQKEVNLSSLGFNDQSIHIAFVNNTDDGFKLYLDNIIVIKDDPASTPDLVFSSVDVFPNPTNGMIKVESELNVTSLTLMGTKGETIITSITDSIDLSSFDNGVYFLIVEFEDGRSESKRIVKI